MGGITTFTPDVDDLPAVTRVHIASWRTTYAGIVPAEHLEALSFDQQLARHQRIIARPGVRYLAARDEAGQIVGFATGGPSRDSDAAAAAGELQAIYLLADCQRRGTGAALVRRLAADLAADGLRSLSVWTLADNPYRLFYERLGGRADREQLIEIGGRSLVEVRYVWPDVAFLLR